MRRRLIPDIVSVQAFECAARHGNFTRAGEELNLTQSAVSRQIMELEQQVGARLFERVRQRVVLSDFGKRFLPEAQKLLSQSERMMTLAVSTSHMKHSLSIATLPSFGSRWLIPRLPKFLKLRPSTAITVESRSVPFDFEEEGFDIAIHYGQPTWAKATSTFLSREVVIPVASREIAELYHDCSPADLINAPLIHLMTRPKLWHQWFTFHGVEPENGFRGNRFDQFSMIIGAAVSGLGVALIPTYLIEEEIRTGALVPIFDKPMATEFGYYIVLPEELRSHEITNAFKDWLIEQADMGISLPQEE
ncbi:LysR family transcriptional regulator [Mesorhizobium sp. SP-1A]|uniref:LysR family transcriptional regulator n=1 Tax=Mesorhizobium sp. SP-1A TaxID=3077840 RepID=UPI0028F6DB19|nr:LysR family transcriptional regulator [Mesorhizobium sp. SP-1A]